MFFSKKGKEVEKINIPERDLIEFIFDKLGANVKELYIAYDTCEIEITIEDEFWFCTCSFILLATCLHLSLAKSNSMGKLSVIYSGVFENFCRKMECLKNKEELLCSFDKFAENTYKDFRTISPSQYTPMFTPYTEMSVRFLELFHDEPLKAEYMKEQLLVSRFISEFMVKTKNFSKFNIIK